MTGPYYQRGGITIWHGDCRDIAPRLPIADIMHTDPPYGIAHPTDYGARGRTKLAQCRDYAPVHGDDKPFDPRWLLPLARRHILWGANHYANLLPPTGGWLVWDKQRPDDLDQATCELAWTDCVKGVRRLVHLWNGMMRASREPLVHPTQKPEALVRWSLSLRWTRDVADVLDLYMGAGSTLAACAALGIPATGVEIVEAYCEAAARRCDEILDQGALFARPAPESATQGALDGVA